MTTAEPHACPYLVGVGGAWRADRPDRAHRCRAVEPQAPLAADKQRRLCLTATHTTCSTYLAAHDLRAAGGEAPAAQRPGGRWGYARQLTIVESTTGPGGAWRSWLGDRRARQAIPAVALVGVLAVLAGSGLGRGPGGTAVASSSPGQTPTSSITPTLTPSPTPRPTATAAPSPSPTPAITASPIPTPSVTPAASFRVYTVKSGDTLYGIARSFGVSLSALTELNNISRTKILHAGDKLLIPNP